MTLDWYGVEGLDNSGTYDTLIQMVMVIVFYKDIYQQCE